jgi:GNAT superfamily N-acetyltransferase
MADVITRSREADGVDFVTTEEDLAAGFKHPLDFDPGSDVLIAETEGKMIGVARVWVKDRAGGKRAYNHSVELLREWRGRGIREELFHYNERYIKGRATKEGKVALGSFELWANDSENEWRAIVVSHGYRPVQHALDMVRNLDDIPEMPLPEGFETREVNPEHYTKIWEANRESSLLDWDYCENDWDEQHLHAFMKMSAFQPHLWQVAWKGDTLAGMILNYIVDEENEELGTKRGHTEDVFVKKEFRGRGLARALLASSFRVLKEHGMNEATLGMEVENPHDPLRLYEGMGYRVTAHFTFYQKPIA